MGIDDTPQAGERPTREISVTVNGETVTREVEPRLKLSDFLRNECGLRGVRLGCEHGVCGACTVELDGDVVKSCLLYAVQAEDLAVETVEGLADEGQLHPVQEAFHEEHALQCGFCTSGFVMATKSLLEENPDPDRDEIEAGLADNICRCTGYQNIYDAVESAAAKLDQEYPRADGGGATDGGPTTSVDSSTPDDSSEVDDGMVPGDGEGGG